MFYTTFPVTTLLSFLANPFYVSFMAFHSNIHQVNADVPLVQFLVFFLCNLLFCTIYSYLLCTLLTAQWWLPHHKTSLISFLSSRARHPQIPPDSVTSISYRILKITTQNWSHDLGIPFLSIHSTEQKCIYLCYQKICTGHVFRPSTTGQFLRDLSLTPNLK